MAASKKIYRALGWLRSLVGVTLAIALVAWVVVQSGINPLIALKKLGPAFFTFLFIVYGVSVLLVTLRWYLLLRHVKVMLSFSDTLRLSLIGLFFNLFVPGGVGGDLIKMVYLKREAGERYPQALLTVILDRVLGLLGLLALTIAAIAANWKIATSDNRELKALLAVTLLCCLGGLVCALIFGAWPWLKSLLGSRLSDWKERIRPGIASALEQLVAALELMRRTPAKLCWPIVVAVAGHLVATFIVFFAVLAIDSESSVNFVSCLLAIQLANLASAVPITPGGIGNRDIVLSLLLVLSGATQEVAGAVPLTVTLLLIGWSLIGGLVFAVEKFGVGFEAKEQDPDAGMVG